MMILQQPDRAQAVACAYNLFRNRDLPDILCAVPEDRPIPPFIGSDRWMFEQSLRSPNARPPGFRDRAAYVAVRFTGFYLFQAIPADPSG
jgi:hypothetical protein